MHWSNLKCSWSTFVPDRMKKYVLIGIGLIGTSFTYAQQDTLYLKNKFNKDGNVVIKDTTFMWAPLFYVHVSGGLPVTGVIVEQHQSGKRLTYAGNGFTLKQVSEAKKWLFCLFYDPVSQNYASIKRMKKKNTFRVHCISKDEYPYGVVFESAKNGTITKTVSKEEKIVTMDSVMKSLFETLPQYRSDFTEILTK